LRISFTAWQRLTPLSPRSWSLALSSSLSNIARQFEQFQEAYARQNYGWAADAFVHALTDNAGIAFRYFAVRASAALALSLHETARVTEVTKRLDEALDEFPDMHLLVDHDSLLIRRLVELREANISKGLPSIVLVTQGKSASIPVANIFNSGFNLPSFAYSLLDRQVVESWARDYARGGACYTTHLTPDAVNVARLKRAGLKVIVHVRDPRQTLLSMIHHISAYPDDFPRLSRSGFTDLEASEQASGFFEYYISCICWIQGWLDAASELDILFSSFEDFVRDRAAFTERYVAFYGGYREHFSWEDATRQQPNTDYHFRAGLTDEWRGVFSLHIAERLNSCLPAPMRDRFGWAC
jgi:hypothetical protein